MTVKQFLIDAVKNEFKGIVRIPDLIEYAKSQGRTIDKKLILRTIRTTLHLVKEHRRKDIIEYIPSPDMPENFQDIQYSFKNPENMEEAIFKFIVDNRYSPNLKIFKEYCKLYYPELFKVFNWNNSDNFYVTKQKVTNRIDETGCIEYV